MESQDRDLTTNNRLDIDVTEIPSSCVIVICDGKVKIR